MERTHNKGQDYLILLVVIIAVFCLGRYLMYNRYGYMYHSMNISTLHFVSPVAGETWTAGKTYKVTWQGGEEKVNLSLADTNSGMQDPSESSILCLKNMINSGYYDFTVPDNLSGTFKFYVWDGDHYTYSDNFTIIKKPVQ